MNAIVEVQNGGHGNSIQDLGRFGHRHQGIPVAGHLDAVLARCANALLGNPETAACVEIRGVGPTLKVCAGPLRIALCGRIAARIQRPDGGVSALNAWSTATLDSDDTLHVGAVAAGTAYLAFSGGIDVAPELGSRSTYARAGIGGLNGRLLAGGDSFPCQRLSWRDPREYRNAPWHHDDGPIHVLAGPQDDHFSARALADFSAQAYTVTAASDRMGMRLNGLLLAHRGADCTDIVSDGVTPGAIQVPGDGQPIILLADCQTVGGYPKIATVISADLCRLGQYDPGATIRFAFVGLDEAARLLAARETRWRRWRQGIEAYRPAGYVDESALYHSNLIGGVLRAEF